jgi:cation diffusion facilitator family transporter
MQPIQKDETDNDEIKARPVLYSLLLNLLFTLSKGVAAFYGSSNALMADAGESLSDVLTSAIVWVGIKTSVKKPDADHPYGHGKAEPISTVLVSIFLISAAVLIANRGWQSLNHQASIPKPYTLIVLSLVIIFKEFTYRYLSRKGKKVNSNAMLAEAWHSRSDALTSLLAFIGITIAIVGGQKYVAADAFSSLIASLIIAFNGLKIFRGGLNELMDAAPPEALVAQVRRIAEGVEGVKRVEQCKGRKMGAYYLVDMHIEVDGSLSVREGHHLAHKVKDAVKSQLPAIHDILVHVEPEKTE